MRLRRALVPALLMAATAVLTACGGDNSSGSQASTDESTSASPSSSATSSDSVGSSDIEACDVLSADQVSAAVGAPVKEGVATSGPAITGGSFTSCLWQSDDPDNPADTATVTIYPNADAADSAREDDSQDVEGIGDRAFSGSFASMWVYVGDRSLFAQWYALSGSDQDNLPKSQALAKVAADAL